MAIGPQEADGRSGDSSTMVADLERRIDVWLKDGWTVDQGYPLPFWVFLEIHNGEFMKMVERYRAAGWSQVSAVFDRTIAIHKLIFFR